MQRIDSYSPRLNKPKPITSFLQSTEFLQAITYDVLLKLKTIITKKVYYAQIDTT